MILSVDVVDAVERVHFLSACLVTSFSLSLFDSLPPPLPSLLPPPSPARAPSLFHPADQSRDHARWQCEHHLRGGRVAHALRQMDAQLRGPDAGG